MTPIARHRTDLPAGEGTLEQVLAGEARWCVLCADCLDVLPTLPDGCVDHVITDPPYGEEAHTKQRRCLRGAGMSTEALSFGALSFGALSFGALSFGALSFGALSSAAAAFGRIARRWVLAFCQVEQSHDWRTQMTAAGLDYVRTAVWVKPDAMPQYTGDRPGMGYESIVIAHPKGRKRWSGGGRVGVFVHNKNSGGKHDHETQKPTPLFAELVELFTDPNDLILDPFAGSGTTGVAALRLGRRVILIEREPKWADLCRERLRAEEQGSTITARRAGQVAMFGGEK